MEVSSVFSMLATRVVLTAVTPVEMNVTVMVSSFCMIEESGLASEVGGESLSGREVSPFCCSSGEGGGEAGCSCSLLSSESECCSCPLALVLCVADARLITLEESWMEVDMESLSEEEVPSRAPWCLGGLEVGCIDSCVVLLYHYYHFHCLVT
jgi:hypothetical protein